MEAEWGVGVVVGAHVMVLEDKGERLKDKGGGVVCVIFRFFVEVSH